MRQLALARLRRTPGRYLAVALAVTLAVGFAVLAQLVGTAVTDLTRTAKVASLGGADLVVQAAWRQDAVDPGDPEALAAAVAADATTLATVAGLDGVAAVQRSGNAYLEAALPGTVGDRTVVVAAVPPEGALRWPTLLAGRWPTAPGEVAVTSDARVGDEVTLRPGPDGQGPVTQVPLDVVGLVDVGLADDFPVDGLFVVPEQAYPLGAGRQELLVQAAPGTDLTTVVATVDAAVGPGSADPLGTVVPAEEVRDARTDGATTVLLVRTGLGAFVALAVAVAVVVVANTFSVLLAQRLREQALLRCVGATRRDLWRAGTTEAVLLGLVAGLAGVLLGTAVAAVAAVVVTRWLPVTVGVLLPTPAEVAAALALGVVATLVASTSAMVRAGRVSPLAALRPAEAVPETGRASLVRVLLGVLLLLVGGAGTVTGALVGRVVLALPAAVLAFVGVLVLAPLLVPLVTRVLGRGVRAVGGPAGALAAASVGRNPRRTAATAGAVVIGVTLAVTAAVGAASLGASGEAELAARAPVDVTVRTPGLDRAGTDALAAAEQAGDGVAVARSAVEAQVLLSPAGQGTSLGTTALAGDLLTVQPDADTVPDDASVVLSRATAADLEVRAGDVVAVTDGSDGATGRSLAVVVDDDTTVAVRLSPTTAAAVGGEDVVLVQLLDGLDRDGVGAAVEQVTTTALAVDPAAQVEAPVLQLGAVQRTLDVLLAVVGGMLAVTVAIALVGVTNTLSLSLTERRQENALLRALGLSRARLRAVVAWEALVLGLVGALVGVVLGVGFGVAGTYSVIGSSGTTVVAVPWLVLAGLTVAVAGVAVAASLWPAARASRVAPASALGAA